MRRILPLLLALSAALLGSCSLTLFDYSNIVSKHYALVYGVTIYDTNYTAGVYPNLNYPGSDASAVAAMLTAEGYTVKSRWIDSAGYEWVNGQQGILLKNDSTLANAPTKINVAADLASMASVVGPNDVFIFYFSGHGMQDTTQSPPVEYFVPEGAVQNGDGVESLSVSDSEFGAMLTPVSSNRKVVVLDTCNSGGFIGNSLESDSIPAASLGSGGSISLQALAQALSNFLNFSASTTGLSPYAHTMVLSAAGRDESCYESSAPFYHGVMTYFLLQAPQSGDLNHDGHVTVAETFSLVKAGIETDWNSDGLVQAYGWTFEPRISGGPVDYVLW